jgi:tetratricopeptide (TPR) repeat protein
MAINLDSKYVQAFYNRALARAQKGDIKGSIEDNTRVIELTPNNAEAYFNRGAAYWKEQNYDLTIADFQKASSLNPAYKTQAAPVIEQAKQFRAEKEAPQKAEVQKA